MFIYVWNWMLFSSLILIILICLLAVGPYNVKVSYFFNYSRELIENSNAPKHQKISTGDHIYLVELLISKDKEIKTMLMLAAEQEKIQHKITTVKAQVDLQVIEKYVVFGRVIWSFCAKQPQ